MILSHLSDMGVHHGHQYYEARLWFLIYNDGRVFTSWNLQDIEDNYELMRESGASPYVTFKSVYFTDVEPFHELYQIAQNRFIKDVSQSYND